MVRPVLLDVLAFRADRAEVALSLSRCRTFLAAERGDDFLVARTSQRFERNRRVERSAVDVFDSQAIRAKVALSSIHVRALFAKEVGQFVKAQKFARKTRRLASACCVSIPV